MRHLSSPAPVVWIVLFRNSIDGEVTIGIKKIAKVTGYSKRHVQRGLDELVEKRFLRVLIHGRKNVGCSKYRLSSPKTSDL